MIFAMCVVHALCLCIWNGRGVAAINDAHFPEHACLHVIEQVAVIGPATEGIGAHQVAEFFAGFDGDGVLAQQFPVTQFQITP